jgi:hypothetical protein
VGGDADGRRVRALLWAGHPLAIGANGVEVVDVEVEPVDLVDDRLFDGLETRPGFELRGMRYALRL